MVGVHNGRLKVAVTQVAERGKANNAVLEVLAVALNLRPSQLRLLAGTTSREKTVLVIGLDCEALASKIGVLIAKTE